MSRNDNKTQQSEVAVSSIIANIKDEGQRNDCNTLLLMMKEITSYEPKIWGKDITGFGQYHYVGKSGREGDWFKAGFAPRSKKLSIYLISGFKNKQDILDKIGKHTVSAGCLYIKNLESINQEALKELIVANIQEMNEQYPES